MTVTSAGINDHSQLNLIDFSNCRSYSVYQNHAVTIMNDGMPMAIGDNTQWPIYKTLPRYINKWTPFRLQDSNRNTYSIESAVCGTDYTLYLLDQFTGENIKPLAYVKKGINKGLPNFISTNGSRIYAIYGGSTISAVIDTNGVIHIINDSIYSNNFCTIQAYLPWGNMPVSLAFQDNFVIALSSFGNVFEFGLIGNEFHYVNALPQCSFISGTANHCIAVTRNGDVFVRGSNEYDQLGLGRNMNRCDEFRQIANLRSQNIKVAYAGAFHSLFINQNGKILACGYNQSGELFKNSSRNNVVQATGTSINSGAVFCIAGSQISVAFINCNPPPKSPNQMLRPSLKSPFLLMFENNDALRKENDDLKAMNSRLWLENNDLKSNNNKLWLENSQNNTINLQNTQIIWQKDKEIAFLQKENAGIKTFKNEITNLKKGNLQQKQIIKSHKKEIELLKIENVVLKKLKQSNAKQYEIINSQNEEIERLKKQIDDLKMQFSSSKYNFNINEIKDDENEIKDDENEIKDDDNEIKDDDNEIKDDDIEIKDDDNEIKDDDNEINNDDNEINNDDIEINDNDKDHDINSDNEDDEYDDNSEEFFKNNKEI